MAIEKIGQMTYVDAAGNEYLLFPKTKAECVDGLTPAAVGAAPAGYGLGENSGRQPYTADLNEITTIGFWAMPGGNAVNYPDKISHSGYGSLLVERRTDKITQTVKFNGYIAVRSSGDNGVSWNEWEYVNPPMVLGKEYRTTERWNGNAVYTRLIDIGHLANKDYVYANLNIATKNIISLDVICHGGTVAFQQNSVAGDGDIMYRTYIENGYLYIQTFTDMSSYTGLCKVKYVK